MGVDFIYISLVKYVSKKLIYIDKLEIYGDILLIYNI